MKKTIDPQEFDKTCAAILRTVIENDRVLFNSNGTLNRHSLEVEIEFEASERGLDDILAAAAVDFALATVITE